MFTDRSVNAAIELEIRAKQLRPSAMLNLRYDTALLKLENDLDAAMRRRATMARGKCDVAQLSHAPTFLGEDDSMASTRFDMSRSAANGRLLEYMRDPVQKKKFVNLGARTAFDIVHQWENALRDQYREQMPLLGR